MVAAGELTYSLPLKQVPKLDARIPDRGKIEFLYSALIDPVYRPSDELKVIEYLVRIELERLSDWDRAS
jgi:hypothetical protein